MGARVVLSNLHTKWVMFELLHSTRLIDRVVFGLVVTLLYMCLDMT